MILTLPLPANRGNARWHWRKEAQLILAYYEACDTLLLCRIVPCPPTEPMSCATIRAHLYTWSTMDQTNLSSRLKWPEDWLVRAGYIVDDSPDVLEWTLPTQSVDRKNQRIELTLEAA